MKSGEGHNYSGQVNLLRNDSFGYGCHRHSIIVPGEQEELAPFPRTATHRLATVQRGDIAT